MKIQKIPKYFNSLNSRKFRNISIQFIKIQKNSEIFQFNSRLIIVQFNSNSQKLKSIQFIPIQFNPALDSKRSYLEIDASLDANSFEIEKLRLSTFQNGTFCCNRRLHITIKLCNVCPAGLLTLRKFWSSTRGPDEVDPPESLGHARSSLCSVDSSRCSRWRDI